MEKNVAVLAELAKVAAQEKSMLEECLELSKFISNLEVHFLTQESRIKI